MGSAKDYIVTWRIAVKASCPEEAARTAMIVQRASPGPSECEVSCDGKYVKTVRVDGVKVIE